MAGIAIGAFMVHRQRASDEHLTTDALQREELRDGWKALGAVAALDAQGSSAPPAPAAPTANVVIVNVPGQSGPAGPQGAPGQPGQTVVLSSPGTAPAVTNSVAPNANNGISALPVAFPSTGYTAGANGQPAQGGTSGIGPNNIPGQATDNGALRGSGTNNPAFPNNAAAGTTPNGAANVSNPTSNVPSGTSNVPAGSPNLPSGVP